MTSRTATYGFAGLVLSLVAILIVPLPPLVLDALLAANILTSAAVLFVSITIQDSLEFAAFAPALLVATLFRLALDVSATRLILTQGHIPGGVGNVIPAFGEFVVRGNLVVGLIVFAILITIQFVVIASGSQRVAEVAARFTLDAMPGKQMAIDAELHAGILDMEAAKRKRAHVQKEADFFGAMDGAGKFVKGDAIAALVIVVLNLIGGVAVGMFYHGMSPGDALSTFALLSIGNALVTTLPAFLMSISMGMMVTRVAADGSLGTDLARQILERPEVLRTMSILAFVLALVPALPQAVFAVFGVVLAAASFAVASRRKTTAAESETARVQAKRAEARRPETALAVVGVDPLAIEFGAELVAMLAAPNSETLLDRISEVRRVVAADTGVVMPGVRLRDDARDPLSYAIRVRDEIVAVGSVRVEQFLAVGRPQALDGINGEMTRDPVFNLPAKWIDPADREKATALGALVFDPISIVGSHLAEVARNRAWQLFGRQEMHTLLEHLRKTQPMLVKDVGTDLMPLATLHRAYVILLRERIWPRDPIATVERILEAAATSRDPADLAEAARTVLVAPMLRRRKLTELPALLFDPGYEAHILEQWRRDGVPDPAIAMHIREAVQNYQRTVPAARAAVICTSQFRRVLSEILDRFGITIDVFAFSELPVDVNVRGSAIIAAPETAARSALAS